MSIAITGTGLYTPEQVIQNDELVASYNQFVKNYNDINHQAIENGIMEALQPSSSAFIEKASGIKQRYVVDKKGILNPERMRPFVAKRDDDEMSLQCEMSLKAIYPALDDAQIEADHVDGIIVACSNYQRPYPAISVEIQKHLQCKGFGFDMNVACSSATFGMATAASLIASGQCQTVVVVSPEICSGHLNFKDRESHFIFGDACTAVVLQKSENVKKDHFKILDTKLSTEFSNNIRNNNGFLTHTECHTTETLPLHLFVQQGRKVFKEVIPMVQEHITQQLSEKQLAAKDVKRLWLHQANQAMNELIAKKILNKEFNETDAPIILDEYANTSSAGSIIAFHKYQDDFAAGDKGVICSFGAGYSVGSVLIEKCN